MTNRADADRISELQSLAPPHAKATASDPSGIDDRGDDLVHGLKAHLSVILLPVDEEGRRGIDAENRLGARTNGLDASTNLLILQTFVEGFLCETGLLRQI